jgi:hypothetical protein
VRAQPRNFICRVFVLPVQRFPDKREEDKMGKGLLLWLIGVPIPVIIVLWLIFR